MTALHVAARPEAAPYQMAATSAATLAWGAAILAAVAGRPPYR